MVVSNPTLRRLRRLRVGLTETAFQAEKSVVLLSHPPRSLGNSATSKTARRANKSG